MFSKLISLFKKEDNDVEKMNENEVFSDSNSTISKSSEFYEEYVKIVDHWVNSGIRLTDVGPALILHSGQGSYLSNMFSHIDNAKNHGLGIWLTEGLSYAKDYCYFRADKTTKGQILFQLKPTRSLPVIEFRPGYHPGSALGRSADSLPSDRFISKHWSNILRILSIKDPRFKVAKGHVRRAQGNDGKRLGVPVGGMVEVWIQDPELLDEVRSVSVPKTQEEFYESYGQCPQKLQNEFWSLVETGPN